MLYLTCYPPLHLAHQFLRSLLDPFRLRGKKLHHGFAAFEVPDPRHLSVDSDRRKADARFQDHRALVLRGQDYFPLPVGHDQGIKAGQQRQLRNIADLCAIVYIVVNIALIFQPGERLQLRQPLNHLLSNPKNHIASAMVAGP